MITPKATPRLTPTLTYQETFGPYSCSTCGPNMKEPCEHWRIMLAALGSEGPAPLTPELRSVHQQLTDDILTRIAKRYENCKVNIYPDMPCKTPVEAVLRCAAEEGFHLAMRSTLAAPHAPARTLCVAYDAGFICSLPKEHEGHHVGFWSDGKRHEWTPAAPVTAPATQTDEIDVLRQVCAEAYQVLGALNGPANLLDNLSAASQGKELPHATVLPFVTAPGQHEQRRLLREFIGYLSMEYGWGQDRWENCAELADAFLAAQGIVVEGK